MTSSTTTTSNTPVMSPFTELDDEMVNEEEIQQLHEELDQLKIVIGRLKPSGTWCF